ncbi:unnamed protein product [Protopolystoma xenopodis]|uniref:Uncharacterized protein n=1 Tax=Protopolystoma xenopodis TaxID=117903 RepID=A0A3S5CFF9_9PLAT|nr:unnamed protein product [Protopolystoma xenopodis]
MLDVTPKLQLPALLCRPSKSGISDDFGGRGGLLFPFPFTLISISGNALLLISTNRILDLASRLRHSSLASQRRRHDRTKLCSCKWVTWSVGVSQPDNVTIVLNSPPMNGIFELFDWRPIQTDSILRGVELSD